VSGAAFAQGARTDVHDGAERSDDLGGAAANGRLAAARVNSGGSIRPTCTRVNIWYEYLHVHVHGRCSYQILCVAEHFRE
jgi:hypothetical protein